MSNLNSRRKVKVNKRSGFDKSFRNTLTAYCGTLVPLLVDELMPDTILRLGEKLAVSLPPLVSDTYMNVRYRVEAFLVPHRLCQANFEEFFSDYPVETISIGDASETNPYSYESDLKACMPLIRLNQYDGGVIPSSFYENGSLSDYMGIPAFADNFDFDVPVAPFIAYHLIWQEWYRNPRVQRPAFMRDFDNSPVVIGYGFTPFAASLPFSSFYFDDNGRQPVLLPDDLLQDNAMQVYKLADGETYITDLRQRNFGLDFFTAAMVEPMQGDAPVVKFGENGDPADGFTLASLRVQNSITQFRERNNLTSPRYQQQLYARYGVAPSDGVIQRPVLVGAATYDVYSHGVVSNSTSSVNSTPGADVENPFGGSVGSRFGNGFAAGSDFLIDNFHVKEPMYLIVLGSLVPEVSYSQNFNPLFLRYKGLGSITDMANGILQNVGPQPIYKGMLGMAGSEGRFYETFAYTDRYSDWMFRNNEVHGEIKQYQGGTLSSFALQRTFSGLPDFGSEFIEIPTTYLDNVLQFDSSTISCSYWIDIMFDYKVSMPLQEYAIPSLQDPGYEHGRTISLRKNGQLL